MSGKIEENAMRVDSEGLIKTPTLVGEGSDEP